MNFECHVTIKTDDLHKELLQAIIESVGGWSFSSIAGDPLLGKDTFCYATAHFDDPMEALVQTTAVSEALAKASVWFHVIRRKIELVISDERCTNGMWHKI